MKKHFFIRILMLVVVISAAVFVFAAVNASNIPAGSEECAQEKEDCIQPRTHSEFLLESLTRTLLAR
jgi:ABC-type cobalt transport system substrate-binding protein